MARGRRILVDTASQFEVRDGGLSIMGTAELSGVPAGSEAVAARVIKTFNTIHGILDPAPAPSVATAG